MCFPLAQAFSTEEKNPAPKCWRYEYMRPADLNEAIQTRPIAWLVLSPLEWHGEAISFGCDPFVGQTIVRNAWEKVGGVLIPTIYIGAETDYKVWEKTGLTDYWGLEVNTKEHNPGSLYVRPITLEMVLRDYLYFLHREGFKLCVVATGHGAIEHLSVMKGVCSQYEKGPMRVLMWGGSGRAPVPQELRFEGAGGHADFSEASLLGGVDPNMVDKTRFGVAPRDKKIGLSQDDAAKIDFDKGRKLIEFRAAQLEKEVNALLKELNL
jgi:creatinine amidohydrolase